MKPSHRQFWIAGSVSLSCLVASYPTSAQIVPDGTLPVNSTVIQQGTTTVIEGGTRAGGNLFHSFDAFSVPTGGAAYFNNALDINNILSRVTGRSISNIDGLIRANGTANLFLLNPNGIIFGPNARLNIGGSFLASTASSFQFADGSFFSAVPSQTTPLLTISVPIGLQYGGNAAEIRVQGAGQTVGLFGISQNFDNASVLGVNPGNTLAIAGGNVILDGGLLQAPGGRVELGGLAGAGTVTINPNFSLTFPQGVARADVLLTNRAGVNVIGGVNGGGSIAINAGSIGMMSQSLLTSGLAFGLGEVNTRAGDITLNATNVTNIDQSRIENNVNSGTTGNSGNIEIATGSFTLTNQGALNTTNFDSGLAGDIVIDAREQVSVTNQSSIVSNGEFGRVLIFSANHSIDINNSILSTESTDDSTIPGQFSSIDLLAPLGSIALNQTTLTTKNLGTGFAGDIRIEAGGQVTVANSDISSDGFFGRISLTSTNNSIDINNTFITTDAVDNRTNTDEFSRINITAPSGSIVLNQNTISTANKGTGFAGDISIEAGGQLSVTNNDISSDGFLGNISLSSTNNSILISNNIITTQGTDDNLDPNQFSSIDILAPLGSVLVNKSTISTTNFGSGFAGDININAGNSIAIANSNIFSQGNFGLIFIGGSEISKETLSPRTVSIDNSTLSTANQSSTSSENTVINAGNIFINGIDSVLLVNNARINSSTYRQGDAGDITIATHYLSMTNGAQLDSSSFGFGNAGNISVQAPNGSVFIAGNGTTIFTTVELGADGNAGNISIDAGAILIAEGATLTSDNLSSGSAGNISLNALGQISLIDSSLTSTSNSDSTDFGDISVTATQGSVFLDRAQLNTTNTKSGFAGDIVVNARNQIEITNQSKITSNGNFGRIFIGSSDIAEETLFPRTVSIDNATLSTTNQGSKSHENVEIDAGNIFISAIDSVFLGSGSGINSSTYRKGDAGSITIATHDLFMTGGAQLDSSSFGDGNAGSITIEAGDGSVFIAGNGTTIFTTVEPKADGDAGNISIDAGAILIAEGAELTSDNKSSGAAGNISLNALGQISLIDSSLTSTSNSDNNAEFGDISVIATQGSVFLERATLNTTNRGSGFAGDITIDARDRIAITDSTISSRGNFGRILIGSQLETEQGIFVSPILVTIDGITTELATDNSTAPNQKAGSIEITAANLVINEAKLSSSTFGAGTAGNISFIASDSVLLVGNRVFTNVEAGATGQGGNIAVNAGSLTLTDGARLETNVLGPSEAVPVGGRANAGSVSIDVLGQVTLTDGSTIVSNLNRGAEGKAGSIEILAGDFWMTNGAQLDSSSFGVGNAGSISVKALNGSVFIAGNETTIFTTVEPEADGDAGNISINAGAILIAEGAKLTSNNESFGLAGEITVQASDLVSVIDSFITSESNSDRSGEVFGTIRVTAPEGSLFFIGSEVSTTNTGSGFAGDIILNARDLLSISDKSTVSSDGNQGRILIGTSNISGETYSPSIVSIDSSTLSTSNGASISNLNREIDAGDISIDAIDGVLLTKGSTINAFTERLGDAGSITINADNGLIYLADKSFIFGTVEPGGIGNGGTIKLAARSLLLEGGSEVQTLIRSSEPDPTEERIAGNINITATEDVFLVGSSVFSTVELGAIGKAGSIDISARSIFITDSGQLNTNNLGSVAAGNINLTGTDQVILRNSTITSKSNNDDVTGEAFGSIIITAPEGSIFLDNSKLSTTNTGSGFAGDIVLNARDEVSIANGSKISSDGYFGRILIGESSASRDEYSQTYSPSVVSIDGSTLSTTNAEATGDEPRDAGAISITAIDSISLLNNSNIQAFTQRVGNAGSVTLLAENGDIFLDGGSFIFSTVEPGAIGDGGSIFIIGRSLSMTDGARLTSTTFGKGDAGLVSVNVSGPVSLAGSTTAIFSTVASGAVGDGGFISIEAGSLSMTDGAQLQTLVRGSSDGLPAGKGDAGLVSVLADDFVSLAGNGTAILSTIGSGATGEAGGILIQANSLSMTDGTYLDSSTFGIGNAGAVIVNVDGSISLTGNDTRIFSTVESGAVGNGGVISITAGSLSMTDGAQLQTLVRTSSSDGLPAGQGEAGTVSVRAKDFVSLAGSGTGIFSTLGLDAVGKAGGILIEANSLSMTGGAVLNASTFGQGGVGIVSVDVDDFVSLAAIGTGIFTTIGSEAEGDALGILIKANSLSMKDGAVLDSSTFGIGDAGTVSIEVTDSVTLAGTDTTIFSTVVSGAKGKGGNILITGRSLSMTDGAALTSSTFGIGNAGSVSIDVDGPVSLADSNIFSTVEPGAEGNGGTVFITGRSLSLTDGAQLQTLVRAEDGSLPGGKGNAGGIDIETTEDVSLSGTNGSVTSSIFSTVEEGADGNAGSIDIEARSIFLRDRAEVTSSNLSSAGSAGSVSLRARNRISLTESSVTATTESGKGGDITINAPDLLVLRRNSNISTSAGQAGAPGDGGNIIIATDNLVALENSDITANAFEGKGGQIFITAESIFGAQVRTREELSALGFDLTKFDASQLPTSDITAISLQGNPNLQGNVSINTPDVDPSQGLVELPVQILDTENQIAQGCAAGKRNEFSVTGRGGLPPIPSEALGDNATWTDFRTPTGNESRSRGTEAPRSQGETPPSRTEIVEAQGWTLNDKGEVVLTAAAPTATLPRSAFLQAGCHQVSTTSE